MKIESDFDSLVLRDSPGCVWLAGAFFLAINGMLLYGSLGGFSNYQTIPSWQLIAATLMSLCGIGVGLWVIFSHPQTTTRIRRPTRKIEICRRGLRGNKLAAYDFRQVREFCVAEREDSDGDSMFEIVMLLTDEKEIPLTHSSNRDRTYCETMTAQLNQFLRQ